MSGKPSSPHFSVFEDTHLQPFLDQVEHALIADPLFQEVDQPFLTDSVEERRHTLPISTTS